ncbi:MAG: hypothetical protein C4527_26160 [Candidatus Omnitrophota bacterium]|nr:MAG: hypothetical protein C4527_26160 [Candidatus Omnitrophota bacterium]
MKRNGGGDGGKIQLKVQRAVSGRKTDDGIVERGNNRIIQHDTAGSMEDDTKRGSPSRRIFRDSGIGHRDFVLGLRHDDIRSVDFRIQIIPQSRYPRRIIDEVGGGFGAVGVGGAECDVSIGIDVHSVISHAVKRKTEILQCHFGAILIFQLQMLRIIGYDIDSRDAGTRVDGDQCHHRGCVQSRVVVIIQFVHEIVGECSQPCISGFQGSGSRLPSFQWLDGNIIRAGRQSINGIIARIRIHGGAVPVSQSAAARQGRNDGIARGGIKRNHVRAVNPGGSIGTENRSGNTADAVFIPGRGIDAGNPGLVIRR